MDELDAAAAAYLQHLCAGFQPLDVPSRQTWQRAGSDQWTTRLIPDDWQIGCLVHISVSKNYTDHPTYETLLRLIKSDPDVISAQEDFGYWATPDRIMNFIVHKAITIQDDLVTLSSSPALAALDELRSSYRKPKIDVVFQTVILGVKLLDLRLVVNQDLELRRLSDEEVVERWSESMEIGIQGPPRPHLFANNVEAQLRMSVPRHNYQIEVSEAHNKAMMIFADLITALRLYQPGQYALGPVRHLDRLHGGTTSLSRFHPFQITPSQTLLTQPDELQLAANFRQVKGIRQDPQLSRAVDRFEMGRERMVPEDALVDYVIAWETLLGTVNKQAAQGEIRYRFSINGASVLHACGVAMDRVKSSRFMRALYDLRSKIVHGDSTTSILKQLASDFPSTQALNQAVVTHLQAAILYLAGLDPAARPYSAPNGWEKMLWPDDASC